MRPKATYHIPLKLYHGPGGFSLIVLERVAVSSSQTNKCKEYKKRFRLDLYNPATKMIGMNVQRVKQRDGEGERERFRILPA